MLGSFHITLLYMFLQKERGQGHFFKQHMQYTAILAVVRIDIFNTKVIYLAHLSQKLIGELIVYPYGPASVVVRPSFTMLKHPLH